MRVGPKPKLNAVSPTDPRAVESVDRPSSDSQSPFRDLDENPGSQAGRQEQPLDSPQGFTEEEALERLSHSLGAIQEILGPRVQPEDTPERLVSSHKAVQRYESQIPEPKKKATPSSDSDVEI